MGAMPVPKAENDIGILPDRQVKATRRAFLRGATVLATNPDANRGSDHAQITQDQCPESCRAIGAQYRPQIGKADQTATAGHQGGFIAGSKDALARRDGTAIEESGDP
jgi:hypothetical protein